MKHPAISSKGCFSTFGHGVIAIAICLTALESAAQNHPAEVYNETDAYESRIASAKEVKALDSAGFGEVINLQNGGLSFVVTDVDLPGNNALPVRLTREFRVRDMQSDLNDYSFKDWRLVIPRVYGTFGNVWNAANPPGAATLNRCSSGNGPVLIGQHVDQFRLGSVHNGVHLEIPDGPSGEILLTQPGVAKPPAENNEPYRWTLDGQTHLRCLPGAAGDGGEGFQAITPDGTRYTFTHMARRELPAISGAILDQTANVGRARQARAEVSLYVTEIRDRFNNTVVFQYGNQPTERLKLISITASDGRVINIEYNNGDYVITDVLAGEKPGSPNEQRRWSYKYEDPSYSGTLSRVVLPQRGQNWSPTVDQEWRYHLAALAQAKIEKQSAAESDNTCLIPATPRNLYAGPLSGTVVHPSGASATYTVELQKHQRDGVLAHCDDLVFPSSGPTIETNAVSFYPFSYYQWTLQTKTIAGPGIEPQTWFYEYNSVSAEAYTLGKALTQQVPPQVPANYRGDPLLCPIQYEFCRRAPCQNDDCAKPSYSIIRRPDGNIERHTFGNTWRYNEGKLLKVELLQTPPDYPASPLILVQSSDYYFDMGQGPHTPGYAGYPQRFGSSIQEYFQGYSAEYHRPSLGWAVVRGGVTFRNFPWLGRNLCLDQLARPCAWVRGHRNEAITYHDDTSNWVLGQLKNFSVDGVETQRTDFYGSNALPWKVFRGGVLSETFTYYPDGTIHTVEDGAENTTTLGDWHRGIPRNVTYEDSTSIRIEVDRNGWPKSKRDEKGEITRYEYDHLGRLSLLDPEGNWSPTTFSFERQADDLWLRSATTLNQRVDTYLDALYRPVQVDKIDVSPAPTLAKRTVLTRYDVMNRKIFESYPIENFVALTGNEYGTQWQYDVLNRQTLLIQDIEPMIPSGAVTATTRTEYLSGLQKRVTNPRNVATTIDLMAFGDPDQTWPVRITAPHGQTTVFTRDVFGNPTRISRTSNYGGTSETLAREYVYDASQRLCKRIEPESGVSIYKYDGAGNLHWSAHGLKIADFGSTEDCSYSLVPSSARIIRSHDDRNRLLSVNYQDPATPNVFYDYFADGTVSYAIRGNFKWDFTYNELKLRETEKLTNLSSGANWLFDPQYRLDGALSSLAYPGEANAPTNFSPNSFGEPTQVGAVAAGVSYHADGSVASVTYANGTVYTRTVNDRFLPNSMSYVRSGTNIYTSGMIYDRNGNLESVTGTLPNSYGYDDLDRLTSANGWQFTYDELDNLRRSVKTGGTLDFDVTDGRMMAVRLGGNPLLTFDYDSRGNMSSSRVASIPGTTYPVVFDRADMVRSHSSPEVDESYQYDAYGHRTFKRSVEGGITTDSTQVHTPDGLLRWDRTGNVTKRYYYLGRQLIAHTVENGATEWYVTDHLGSNVARWSASASLDTSRFSPFGERVGLPEAYGAEVGPGYAGHYEDSTALTYMKARYYSAVTGRFLSPDPVGVDPMTGANFNRYWYANNNPMKYVDPDGRESACFSTGVGCGLTPITPEIEEQQAIAMGALAAVALIAVPDPTDAFLASLSVRIFSSASRVDRLLSKVTDFSRTKGPTKVGSRDGGWDQAQRDFKALKLSDVKPITDKRTGEVIGQRGTSSDGRTVVIREKSTDGRPTIEIRRPNGRGEEIRYNEKVESK